MSIFPQPKAESEDTRIDYFGVITVSVGLVALLLAFDQVLDWGGWGDPRILALLGLFAVGIAAFAFVERAVGRNALVPGDVMRDRNFTSCAAILFISSKRPDLSILEVARATGIPLLTTHHGMFDACGILYQAHLALAIEA